MVFAFILPASFTGFREGTVPPTLLPVALIFVGRQVADGLFVRDNTSNLSHMEWLAGAWGTPSTGAAERFFRDFRRVAVFPVESRREMWYDLIVKQRAFLTVYLYKEELQ